MVRQHGFRKVITYGASMGGFGASAHSGFLNATTSIAIAPQYSIDRAKVPFEKRWRREAEKLDFIYDDMPSQVSSSAQKFYIYDPNSDDRHHIELFARFSNTHLIPVPYSGHVPGHAILHAGLLKSLIRDLAEDTFDVRAFRSAMHLGRRKSPVYWHALGEVAMRSKHLPAALHATEQGLRLAPGELAQQLLRANILLRLARYETAMAYAQDLIRASPQHPACWRVLSLAALHLRLHDQSVDAARRAVSLRPQDADLHRVLLGALLEAGLPHEAATQGLLTIGMDASFVGSYIQTANALHMIGDHRRSSELLLVAETLAHTSAQKKQISDLKVKLTDSFPAEGPSPATEMSSDMRTKEKPAPAVLFENENLVVRAVLRGGEQCFVTFTSLNHADDTGFGEGFLHKAGYSAIHVLAKWNHWYSVPEMTEVTDLIQTELRRRRFRTVITYGASMGGSGALLHSRALKAKKVIAVAPQYNIDPSCPPFDGRWAAEATKISQRYGDVPGSVLDTAAKFYLYDPHTPDAGHVNLYLQIRGGVAVPAPFCGHTPARVLQDSRILRDFILDIDADRFDRLAFSRRLRQSKRASSHYWNALAEYAARRRPSFALHAAEQGLKIRPDDLRVQILRGNLLARLRRFDESMQAAEQAITLKPEHPAPWRILSVAAQHLRKWDVAVEAAEKAIRCRPRDADLHRVLLEALLLAGRHPEAAQQARVAVELASRSGRWWSPSRPVSLAARSSGSRIAASISSPPRRGDGRALPRALLRRSGDGR